MLFCEYGENPNIDLRRPGVMRKIVKREARFHEYFGGGGSVTATLECGHTRWWKASKEPKITTRRVKCIDCTLALVDESA